ncbi:MULTISPECIES: GNAT family N-acetyltransferase [Pseudomonas fluorescens group]|uniref:GNAT family N-acetyltransferase n=1 Tax=Pseudomonas fluorescens group TaxID=136843 RepID=UPI001E5CAE94|nr:GNAT family N-acetyltransferase [Pseudomonas fluorescens]
MAEHRRSGVGMALLEAYALDAAAQGFTQLRLSVRPENPAKFMYQKAGFLHTGTEAHGYLRYERHA